MSHMCYFWTSFVLLSFMYVVAGIVFIAVVLNDKQLKYILDTLPNHASFLQSKYYR